MDALKSSYEPRVLPLRVAILNDETLNVILSRNASSLLLECFLIEWFTRLPYMDKPAAKWLRCASEKCQKLERHDIAQALWANAEYEEKKDPLSLEDARELARIASAEHGVEIDVNAILAERPSVAMLAYRMLNEEVLSADVPLGHIAVRHEIERATSALCLALLVRVQRKLGSKVSTKLQWLRDRAPLSVERARQYGSMLSEIIEEQGDLADMLAEIGGGALDIYGRFLHDCAEAARARANALESKETNLRFQITRIDVRKRVFARS